MIQFYKLVEVLSVSIGFSLDSLANAKKATETV